MANTLGGINLAAIAEQSLDYLSYEFFPITAVATDFSGDIATKGESVTTRIVSGLTAQDLSSGYASAAQDVTSTAVTVTLNNFYGVPYGFNDLEVSKAGDANWLRDNFVAPAMEGLKDKIMQTIFTLCTTANYSNETISTAANFDSDDLADIAGALTKLKVPASKRSAILDPDYYTALIKDAVVEDASAFGDNQAIKEGVVQRVRGVNVFQYASVPGLSENFTGMVLHPSAIALAARTVADPTDLNADAPVLVENREDPVTSLPLQFRAWYDANAGKTYFCVASLWGVAKGQANSMHRIVSSA